MFSRVFNILPELSFFLFGARGTGKTTLLAKLLPQSEAIWVDLLDPALYSRYASRPELLSDDISPARGAKRWVVVDEIQRVPALLDVVHQTIFKKDFLFALTGSSARKLKRSGVNLLAGRAVVEHLFPLTAQEAQATHTLDDILRWGSLPQTLTLASPEQRIAYLESYARTYLTEEILAEQLIRGEAPYRRFLEIAAQMNGKLINYTAIARDINVEPNTVRNYFQIVEDTLIGLLLPAYHASIRKRQRQAPKFYLFDAGVGGAISGGVRAELSRGTYAYGTAFEQFVVLECHRLNSYRRAGFRFSYFRTAADAEIDLIVERPGLPIAVVEIKSADRVPEHDIQQFARVSAPFGKCDRFLFCQEPLPRRMENIHVLPWLQGLIEIGLLTA